MRADQFSCQPPGRYSQRAVRTIVAVAVVASRFYRSGWVSDLHPVYGTGRSAVCERLAGRCFHGLRASLVDGLWSRNPEGAEPSNLTAQPSCRHTRGLATTDPLIGFTGQLGPNSGFCTHELGWFLESLRSSHCYLLSEAASWRTGPLGMEISGARERGVNLDRSE
ncbi:unnamed protein product [Pleuronectes platessa]|uniref:Uncharacterized protein n=1 Tax=Pleuronectes platessa TaxID=8262 RepID=A0A9N7VXJ0_PLEPL|nr:unnamed protein product [Pleuronectes platessa]